MRRLRAIKSTVTMWRCVVQQLGAEDSVNQRSDLTLDYVSLQGEDIEVTRNEVGGDC